MVENSLEGGFGATFYSVRHKGRWRHPDEKKNLNTKAVLYDWLYRIKKPLITYILVLTVLLLQYISWGAQRGSWAHRLMHNGPLHERPNHKEALGCGWWQTRRGGEEAESVPLRPTWSPGVLMLLHFHETTLWQNCTRTTRHSLTYIQKPLSSKKTLLFSVRMHFNQVLQSKRALLTLIAFKCYEWQK